MFNIDPLKQDIPIMVNPKKVSKSILSFAHEETKSSLERKNSARSWSNVMEGPILTEPDLK